MTFLQKLALYVTTGCLIIIYFLIGLLPCALFWLTWSAWWFLLYLLIVPGMLLTAAIVEDTAIKQNKKAGGSK